MQKVAGVLIGGMVVLAVIFTSLDRNDRVEPGVGDYVDDYGGSRTAYARILAMTDCAQLQERFDTAAANNDAAEPGTDPHWWSLGFMTASEDRRQALGC